MENIAEGNLFMMCGELRDAALTEMPGGYHVRKCRPDELDIWKRMQFNTPEDAEKYAGFMDGYFQSVYAPSGGEFSERCLFACDAADMPVGTCFIWRAYEQISTLHWFKVRRDHEGRGIGRALLSAAMRPLASGDYPVFLHTHPASVRAIKLYSDFGFALLTDSTIGYRKNHIDEALEYLKDGMTEAAYANLRFATAPEALLRAALSKREEEF